jgi:hypothetical protein
VTAWATVISSFSRYYLPQLSVASIAEGTCIPKMITGRVIETLRPAPSVDRPAVKLASFRRWKSEPRVCVSRSFVSWGELLRLCRLGA